MNQYRFALYLGRILAPQLRRGDVPVLDNLRAHHLTGLREWLSQRDIEVLFLPLYSPDFIPIEQTWSKRKTKLFKSKRISARPWKRPYALPPTGLLATMRKLSLIATAMMHTAHETNIALEL